MPDDTRQHQHLRPPSQPQHMAERLVSVETQQEHDLLTGERVERLFVKLYVAARTSGLLAAISDRDFKTLCTLATYMDRDGYCYPSQTELAKALGVSRQMANERVQQLAKFRFQGKPVMLATDQERGGHGRFGGQRYRILPIASLAIFDQSPGTSRETAAPRPTVSTPLDKVRPTVSSPTVTVGLDTNKSRIGEQENERQQHPQPPSPAGSARPTERVVVVSSKPSQGTADGAEAPSHSGRGVRPAPFPGSLTPVAAAQLDSTVTDALSLAGLQNELIERGVSEAAAHKWLRERTPEYIAQLLDYHAWCKEHRPNFILDHGAWLTASLKNPIDFPERYLRFKEEAPRHAAEQRRRTEQERMALLNEARRHVGAPEERAKCALRGWIQGYQAAHRGQVPTEEHQQRWYEGRLRNIKLEDEEFFAEHAEHPELRDIAAQSLASEHKGTPDESLVSPSA